MNVRSVSLRRFTGAAAAALVAALAGVGPGFAQNTAAPSTGSVQLAQSTDNPFAALVGKRRDRQSEGREAQGVERYVLTTDNRAFLFEERGAGARVRFLCLPDDARIDCVLDATGPSPEIYQLDATRGPRGDVIYKNSEDETLLRIAAYGGATVFWPGETQGVAASKSFGDDRPLALIYQDYDAAIRRAQGASAQLSAITGTTLFFDVSAGRRAVGDNAAVLADAVLTAAKGLALVAKDETGARAVAARIKRVAFLPGAEPGVSLNGSVLEIIYVPTLDINGRPSSSRVARYLEETL